MGSSKGRSAERRRMQRLALKVPVDYSAVDSFFTEFSSNINEGGMFVETENPAEPGTQVQLEFRLPERSTPLRVNGRVAWTSDGKSGSPAGIGIEFQDLPSETRRTIDRLVRRLRRP